MDSISKDDPALDCLDAKFGADADLYAEVRAEAADAAGSPEDAREWERRAAELKAQEERGDHGE